MDRRGRAACRRIRIGDRVLSRTGQRSRGGRSCRRGIKRGNVDRGNMAGCNRTEVTATSICRCDVDRGGGGCPCRIGQDHIVRGPVQCQSLAQSEAVQGDGAATGQRHGIGRRGKSETNKVENACTLTQRQIGKPGDRGGEAGKERIRCRVSHRHDQGIDPATATDRAGGHAPGKIDGIIARTQRNHFSGARGKVQHNRPAAAFEAGVRAKRQVNLSGGGRSIHIGEVRRAAQIEHVAVAGQS